MTVSVDEIRQAMKTLARAIKTQPYGEQLWPIFERLERELKAAEDKEARLKTALEYEPKN
ncbi:hypothetical protein ASE36_06035 [Rhizobium sp. Root274]|uniref:hypothetical protein n=1 Tax=unclassified Rhizobium TaxID=2613769 RepID=UPI000715DF8F|nr:MULTISPECIES: hypothetical protein [unclassified Rhizobium]KQW31780.1 hypothetical protein ASC71_06040 [Rhizobium sp. Root1240]KRD33320.1 hypothetical protein ASE36_06035 [Rhizobium sp. Root274]